MLDQARGEVLIQGSTSLAIIRLMRCGREVTGALGALPSEIEISKGIMEQEPKSVLELEKTPGKLRRTSPSSSMANGVQSGPCRSNAIAPTCDSSRSQTCRNETRCSEVKHEGEAVAAAAARGET